MCGRRNFFCITFQYSAFHPSEAQAVLQTITFKPCLLKGKTPIDLKWVSNQTHRKNSQLVHSLRKREVENCVQDNPRYGVILCIYPQHPEIPLGDRVRCSLNFYRSNMLGHRVVLTLMLQMR